MAGPDEPRDTPERWERIQGVFHAAAELRGAARDAFVLEACGDDAALLARVRALLAADAATTSGGVLEGGLAAMAGRVLDGAAAEALPREGFGPYRLTGVLGEGGMGVVYRAFRADLSSEAAVKLLRDAALSPMRRERFAFEQRALAQLNHSSIARLYDANVTPDGTPWFAMELVEGVPLTEYCESRALPIGARLALFREVCEGVRHAHAHLILHRDLKPSNILVRDDGRVKLLDFGIAKSIEAIEDPAFATRTGLRLMTPAYAAPEQVLGGPLGVHTDVYSLGVVLYELLTGVLPFDLAGRTPSEAATILTEHEPRRPSLNGAGALPARLATKREWADLDVLCLTAMHRDPARRYPNVDALLRDVDRFLSDQPLEARGDSWRYRAGKFVHRHAPAVTSAALALVVLVSVVTFYTLRLGAERDRALAANARRAATQDLLVKLVQGDENSGPSDTLRVITIVRRGEEQLRELEDQPELKAEMGRTLGAQEQELGHGEQAESLLVHALADTRRARHPDPDDEVRSLLALSDLHADGDAAARARAEAEAREALALADRRSPGDLALRARVLARLGNVLAGRGDFARAFAVLEDAIRIQANAGHPGPEWSWSMTALANAHATHGDVAASDSLDRLVLQFDRKRFGPRHPNVATDLDALALIAMERGQGAEAERNEREALAIARGWYGEDHPRTAPFRMRLATILASEERYDEAKEVLGSVLGIYERLYGSDHPLLGGVLNVLGQVAAGGKRWDEAIAFYTRAAAILRRAEGEHSANVGMMLSNLASVSLMRGDAARAEQGYRAALEAYRGAVDPGATDPAIARSNLGVALLRQKKFAEAERESRAAYAALVKQQSGASPYLRSTRKALAIECDSLGRHAEAARYRAENAAADSAASH